MHFSRSDDKWKWIELYVDRETDGARQCIEAAEPAIVLKQEVTETAVNSGLTTRVAEEMFHKMMVAIGDSLCDIADSEDGEDAEHASDELTEPGMLSEADEPIWVMGTISLMVQHRMERCRQEEMKLEVFTQPGWGDAADSFRQRDNHYSTVELMVQAVVVSQRHQDVAEPAPSAFGVLVEWVDTVPGGSHMPQGTSRPGTSHMRLDSGRP